jgi:hypothetical protein
MLYIITIKCQLQSLQRSTPNKLSTKKQLRYVLESIESFVTLEQETCKWTETSRLRLLLPSIKIIYLKHGLIEIKKC